MPHHKTHITLLILFCTLFCLGPCFGQQDSIIINTLSADDTAPLSYDSIQLQPGVIYTIYYPQQYPNSTYKPLKLNASEPITFRHRDGIPSTNGNTFETKVYSGDTTPTKLLGTTRTDQPSGLEDVYYVTQQGESMFLLSNGENHNNYLMDTHFDVFAYTNQESSPYDIRINDDSEGNITLRWSDSSDATRWTICYGRNHFANEYTIETNNTLLQLPGMELSTNYYFRIFNNAGCTINSDYRLTPPHKYRTKCNDQNRSCIDYTDLTSCATQGYYGSFIYPNQYRGIVDFGSDSIDSRHTVYTTDQTDPRTGNKLHTLTPSGKPSVRIGNWKSGAEAESIAYGLHVDTNNHGLLVVHYAIVFQSPNHDSIQQPHVSIQIVDDQLNPIDPACGAADFYATPYLGWSSESSGGYRLWKDWSSIGLDLSPYHGQDIYVKIENYDCWGGGHYGYCYIAIDCLDKMLKSNHCGPMDSTTLTAPPGFKYRWFPENNPDSTIGIAQTFSTTIPGFYCCQLSMPDGDSNCHFTLKTHVGDRYPWADFSYEEENDSILCESSIRFHDLSTVSASPSLLSDLQERVDSVSWDFGDGTHSSERSPIHHYPHGGSYQVKLYAYLANGDCEDVKTQIIEVRENPCTFDTISVGICNLDSCYRFYGTLLCDTGTYDLQNGLRHTHLILFHDSLPHNAYLTLNTNFHQLPFTYNGTSFNEPISDYQFFLINSQGCDSILHLTLIIHGDTTVHLDTTICKELFPLSWDSHTFSQPQDFIVEATGAYGQDSTTIYSVRQSDISAHIVATPSVVSSLNPIIQLSDEGNGVSRLWLLPDRTSSERSFSYSYPISFDSIPVILLAYDSLGCSDSDSITLHLLQEALWAPNIFTPEQESNNRFYVLGEGISSITVSVFSREGLLVSQFSGLDGYWDGTATGHNINAHGGAPCPQSTYTYLISYTHTSSPNHLQHQRGTVTLLR